MPSICLTTLKEGKGVMFKHPFSRSRTTRGCHAKINENFWEKIRRFIHQNKILKYCALIILIMNDLGLLSYPVEFITSDAVVSSDLASNAIIRMEPGFEKDFLVLHCLIKKIQPRKLFEVGTCEGYGTLIMANACSSAHIISLDLPPYTAPFYLTPTDIGKKCNRPYEQVFGDSLSYNFEQHFPIDAWFIDAAHDYVHVKYETEQAVKSNARLIVYHDTDIEEVLRAIVDVLGDTEYKIYRITDTRVSYAIK